MEAQEIFDKVATHLFTQGCRSAAYPKDTMGVCLYRGPNGTSCAVGVLIPDELYALEMESDTITDLLEEDVICGKWKLPSWMHENEAMLTSLQGAHDYPGNWYITANMQRALRNVAKSYRLSADVLAGLAFAWETKAEEV